jgi:RHS repeat-associated protein
VTADPTSGKSFTYWPSDNALWTVSSPWTAMSYDPLGRLAHIDSASDTGFAYDGLDMIAEYDGAGTMLARYVHGPGPSAGSGQAIDQPLVRYDGSGTSNKQSLHADERGSIAALSYGSPYAPTINRYDEYGKPQAGNIGRFQYTGQMWLGEAGAYHYKARAYSPTFGGRFLQTDPIDVEGGINLYAYVGNDPVNWVDPLGLRVPGDGCEVNTTVCGTRDPVGGGGGGGTSSLVDFKKLAKFIDKFAEDYLKPPEPRRPGETFLQCVSRLSGLSPAAVIAGLSGIAAGGPFLGYPATTLGGGGGGTSLISFAARGAFGNLKFPGSLGKMSRKMVGTASVGGATGRVASVTSVAGGAALAGFAAGTLAGAVQKCQ